jgi:hypothetical protein
MDISCIGKFNCKFAILAIAAKIVANKFKNHGKKVKTKIL